MSHTEYKNEQTPNSDTYDPNHNLIPNLAIPTS